MFTDTFYMILVGAYCVKHITLLTVHVACIRFTYLLFFKISISRYFQNILLISYRNWNPDIELSLDHTHRKNSQTNDNKHQTTYANVCYQILEVT